MATWLEFGVVVYAADPLSLDEASHIDNTIEATW